jgi:NADH-quinone oxidoreductase subunit H
MLVRWTIPRFRYDQLMGLAWKVLIPLGIANLVVALTVRHFEWNPWLLPLASLAILIGTPAITARLPSPGLQKEVAFRGHELPLIRLGDKVDQRTL